MSTYNFLGYLSALDMRPFRTLLVEGPTDRKILSRLLNSLIEAGVVAPDSVVIDTTELIDRSGFSMGVREFVEHVHANSTAGVDQFFAVVDREFRGFDFVPPPTDLINTHYLASPNCMWTRGHSIENYMFSPDAIIEYLREYYPESVPVSSYPVVTEHFSEALKWCGALSLALYEGSLISRAAGVCRKEHWDLSGRRLDVEPIAFELAKRCRPGFDPVRFSSRVADWHTELQAASPNLPRWIAHGHLSYSLLWAVVGRTLASLGVALDVVEQIETGMNDNKLRSSASWWQRQVDDNSPEYPAPLLEWLRMTPDASTVS